MVVESKEETSTTDQAKAVKKKSLVMTQIKFVKAKPKDDLDFRM